MSFYYFGVEIEVVVEPHNKQQPVTEPVKDNLEIWYHKIVAALRNRKGCEQKFLDAIAEPQRARYRGQADRHLKWWVTWDGSLVHPEWPRHPGVPFEAVSPRLETRKRWEDEIDAFWSAMRAVFHTPRRISRCGSHVHVSPGRGYFQVRELQAIAFAVVFYDEQVQQVLPESRRNHPFCTPNKSCRRLRDMSISEVAAAINGVQSKEDLVSLMQGLGKKDRSVLWNFQNVTPMPHTSTERVTHTVEFRGGRCLRGPVRTKRWIAFAVAFIILAIREFKVPLQKAYPSTSQANFWEKIKSAAATENMAQFLPATYKIMNESTRSNITDDDPGEDYPYDRPNSFYVPQSAGNSAVNTPEASDAEDDYT